MDIERQEADLDGVLLLANIEMEYYEMAYSVIIKEKNVSIIEV